MDGFSEIVAIRMSWSAFSNKHTNKQRKQKKRWGIYSRLECKYAGIDYSSCKILCYKSKLSAKLANDFQMCEKVITVTAFLGIFISLSVEYSTTYKFYQQAENS